MSKERQKNPKSHCIIMCRPFSFSNDDTGATKKLDCILYVTETFTSIKTIITNVLYGLMRLLARRALEGQSHQFLASLWRTKKCMCNSKNNGPVSLKWLFYRIDADSVAYDLV